MFSPFFVLAAVSPTRQATFRRAVFAHLMVLTAAGFFLVSNGPRSSPMLLGQVLLTAGIVEGALLVGWRLTQIPKSQALEFLLVSPLQPGRVLLGEAFVGLTFLAFVTLSGLPFLALLAAVGFLDPLDLVPLMLVPFTWGTITGVGLTVWAYEPRAFRKKGEFVLLGMVLLYLIIGVLAAEKLRTWLEQLPHALAVEILRAVHGMHEYNPFGEMRHWLEADAGIDWQRAVLLEGLGLCGVVLLLARAASRLQGHFHERHYDPVRDVRGERRTPVGEHPLAWWAVKRVTEYSGRINLWLAGGFCALYSAYLLAGDHWPAWLGQRIFQLCDANGGPAGLAAALVVLAAVPAAFQYGLWDSSVQDRCRRLELLLLTHLRARDYWDAAFAAAWQRGRGYFAIALVLWGAALLGGRLGLAGTVAAVATAALLWALYFALGFRAFARGAQANGLGLFLTVGLPLLAFSLAVGGFSTLAAWMPPGMVYRAGAGAGGAVWLVGPLATAGITLLITRRALTDCDAQLRRWYDLNSGRKVMS